MKKIIYSLAVFILGVSIVNANVVVKGTAQTVAANFYSQTTQKQVSDITLSYTELSSTGDPVYFAFNINGAEGFVLVSAEDAGLPIIGYSTEGNYIVPTATTNAELSYWMQLRKTEIEEMRVNNIKPDAATAKAWTDYVMNKNHAPATLSTAHAPLVQSKWNQNGGGSIAYNHFCPGGSVVGCVATTMAQIMRYWGYPATGTGSHSYNAGSYGTLTANFAKAYNWAKMPFTSSNTDVAQLSYDNGVSVNMNYSPSGSGAQVGGGNPSAQYSYKTYFKYDPTLQYLNYSGNASTWAAMLIAEFAAGRPVQYVGSDPSVGGHTWVADGNDASDKIHMNWGWGGFDDGYFVITSLVTSSGDFSSNMAALIGIKPIVSSALDAGVFTVSSPTGNTCSTSFIPSFDLKNYGSTTLTSCTIKYHLDSNPDQTYNWSGSLGSYQSTTVTLPSMTSTVGAHNFVVTTSMPNGSADPVTSNDQLQTSINILGSTSSMQAPYIEGFENAGFPYADNYITSSAGAKWTTTTSAFSSGASSMKLDNYSATVSDVDEFITPAIDMSTITGQTMTFKLAHAQRNASDVDQLLVFTSTSCSGAWTQRYSKSGATLANAGVVSSAFTPTSSQWRQETVPIANVGGQTYVRFKFQFTSNGSGNNIYIDDININGTLGAVSEEFVNGFDLNVYPNPFSDKSTISFNIQDKYSVAVGVYDIIGKEVMSISNKSDLSAGSYTLPLNKGTLKSGIYFVKLDVEGYSVTKKVIVQ